MAKKKFRDTTVGKILGGTLGLINPTLGGLVGGTATVEDLIQAIKDSNVPVDDKIKAQELVIQAYEAEVTDRVAARQREAQVASAGGSDWLFKAVGVGITLAFLFMTASAMGLIDPPQTVNQRMWDVAFGAITAKMTAVVSYYFGSSIGSKQKTDILNK